MLRDPPSQSLNFRDATLFFNPEAVFKFRLRGRQLLAVFISVPAMHVLPAIKARTRKMPRLPNKQQTFSKERVCFP